MTTKTTFLTPSLYQYLLDIAVREPAVLQALRMETAKLPGGSMALAPEQGQLLALLVKLMDAKNTIDIGTFTGYSALSVALALPENGQVITCDVNDQTTQLAKTYWQKAQVAHKITLQLAPALNTLNHLLNQHKAGQFDFIFIDADKSNYVNYYEKSLLLLRRGGLIVVDNVLWAGALLDPTDQSQSTKAIREFNQKIAKDPRVEISLIPLGDGLLLTRKISD